MGRDPRRPPVQQRQRRPPSRAGARGQFPVEERQRLGGGQPRHRRRQAQSQAGAAARRPERHCASIRGQAGSSSVRSQLRAAGAGRTAGQHQRAHHARALDHARVQVRDAGGDPGLGQRRVGGVGGEPVPRGDDHQGQRRARRPSLTGTAAAASAGARAPTAAPAAAPPRPAARRRARRAARPATRPTAATSRRPAHPPGPPPRPRAAPRRPRRPGPLPRTWTRIARRAASRPHRAPAAAMDARRARPDRAAAVRRSPVPPRTASAAGPPATSGRPSDPPAPAGPPATSARPSGSPIARASSAAAASPACRRSAPGSCRSPVSTGPDQHRMRGRHPELHRLPVPPAAPQRGLHHRMHIGLPFDSISEIRSPDQNARTRRDRCRKLSTGGAR